MAFPTVAQRAHALFDFLRKHVRRLKIETHAIYLACKDPRVPWYAKLFAACVVAYALSPIDLIPDFIPVLGYLDDIIIVPLGITLVLKMIPRDVMAECRDKAERELASAKRTSWIGAAIVVLIWLGLAAGCAFIAFKLLRRK